MENRKTKKISRSCDHMAEDRRSRYVTISDEFRFNVDRNLTQERVILYLIRSSFPFSLRIVYPGRKHRKATKQGQSARWTLNTRIEDQHFLYNHQHKTIIFESNSWRGRGEPIIKKNRNFLWPSIGIWSDKMMVVVSRQIWSRFSCTTDVKAPYCRRQIEEHGHAVILVVSFVHISNGPSSHNFLLRKAFFVVICLMRFYKIMYYYFLSFFAQVQI